LPEHLIYIVFFFLLGACVGSFLNVVVWRLPRGESLVTPPSHCPNCDRQLLWYDNVPIVGWLKLRGKCRFCGQPISPRYPLVETFTALLFAGYYVLFFLYNVGPAPSPARPAAGGSSAARSTSPPTGPSTPSTSPPSACCWRRA